MGARIITLLLGYFANRSMATSNATVVLPSPVGNTTSVFELIAESAMDCWYFLAVMPTGSNDCTL